MGAGPSRSWLRPCRRRREQVVDHHFQRFAAARIQAQVEAGDFAAHADAVVEAGHGDLVGLVQNGETGAAAAFTIGTVIE
jgi:hypothetical protein